jgi:hypothetical protein
MIILSNGPTRRFGIEVMHEGTKRNNENGGGPGLTVTTR